MSLRARPCNEPEGRVDTLASMQQRSLGATGLKVSRLGLGTMTWGRDTDEHEARDQLIAFAEAGGTLVDTAAGYGDGASEELIGTLLGDVVSRDEVVLATKAGISTIANVMAKELGPLGVTCNTVAITAIDSDMLSQLPRDKIEAIIAGLPVARFAEADDILNVIDFLAAERSSYITAQTIFLGGVN